MLKLESIETHYGKSQALFGMDLEIKPGEAIALMGRNGMGKTTTVKSIMGLAMVTSGKIYFKEADITNQQSFLTAKMGIGLVPEGRHVFSSLSVKENLIATSTTKNNNFWSLERVLALFPGLEYRINSMGSHLSGGEQQMLSIGRALMTNPDLIILDEATEGLAPLIRKKIFDCLSEIKKNGVSILVIDKNLALMTEICDRFYIVQKGQTVFSVLKKDLETDKEKINQYLGV
jgi:branched-chain amino acid transport system ATP-binding protein